MKYRLKKKEKPKAIGLVEIKVKVPETCISLDLEGLFYGEDGLVDKFWHGYLPDEVEEMLKQGKRPEGKET